MRRPTLLSLLFASSLALAACSSVRQSKPLVYTGEDARTSVGPLKAAIAKRGYKPICEERAFCKFQYGTSVWIHYKTSAKKVVLAVDVADGKEMAPDKRKSLTDEATAVGEEIWREASAAAVQHEKAEADQERDEAEKKKAEEERAAAEEKKAAANSGSSGSTLGGVLGAAAGVLDGINKAQGGASGSASGSTSCCINGAFYDCKSPGALNKCAGEFSACVSKGMMGSDMSCSDRCLKDHPPDPSGCDRAPQRDNECHK